MFKGYLGAVVASISISVGLNKGFSPLTSWMSGARMLIFSTIFNWIGVSAANATNIMLMRNKELKEGIQVKDQSGKEYGKSLIAGKTALT